MVAVFLLSTQAPLCSCRRDITSASQTTTALCQSPQSRRLLLCRAAAYISSDVPLFSFFKHPVSRALARIFRRLRSSIPVPTSPQVGPLLRPRLPRGPHVQVTRMVYNALQSFPNLEKLSLAYPSPNQGPSLPGESFAARDFDEDGPPSASAPPRAQGPVLPHLPGHIVPHPLPSYLYRPRTLLRRQPHRNLYNCSALFGCLAGYAQLSLHLFFQGPTMRSPSAWRRTAMASSPCMSRSSARRSISPPSPASPSPRSPPHADLGRDRRPGEPVG